MHTKFTRHREDNLSTDARRLRFDLMHIHPDVDVWNEPATAGGFKIAPCCESVEASDHDIAAAQQFRTLFPLPEMHLFIAAITDEPQHSLRDGDFWRALNGITRACANKTIQIAWFDAVAIETSNVPCTDMSKLLDYV